MHERDRDVLQLRVGNAELIVPAAMMPQLLLAIAILSPTLVVYLLTHGP